VRLSPFLVGGIMKLQSKPNLTVTKIIKKQGRKKVVSWFKFDDKGFAIVDESKLSAVDIQKLKKKFKVVEDEYSCKKCEFTTDNKGALMAHYKMHKKEEQ